MKIRFREVSHRSLLQQPTCLSFKFNAIKSRASCLRPWDCSIPLWVRSACEEAQGLDVSYAYYSVLCLAILRCEGNRLSGSLPPEFFALTQLATLAISNNTQLSIDLEGITQLSNLRVFRAGFTRIQGTLPVDLFPSITAMHTWTTEGALLSGTLPNELSRWNASLKTLQLQNNQLNGTLPEGLDALTLLEELKLEGNVGLSGTVSTTLCDRKGTRFGELRELTVDCTVECSCCDSYEESCG